PPCDHLWDDDVISAPRSAQKPQRCLARHRAALSRHGRKLVARTRPAGRRPLLELGDELVVRYRHWWPVAARVPAPEHQLVLADMREERREIAAAIALPVLDRLAQRARRETDPRHLVVRWRQAPMRRARRRVRAVARVRVG